MLLSKYARSPPEPDRRSFLQSALLDPVEYPLELLG
jgi:hypothetical protein